MLTLTFPFSWVSHACADSKVGADPVTRGPVVATGESKAKVTSDDLWELLYFDPFVFSIVASEVDGAMDDAKDPREVED